MNLEIFKDKKSFYLGLKLLFEELNVPVNIVDEKPLKPETILSRFYNSNNPTYQLMDDVYFLGMVDDAAFVDSTTHEISDIKKAKKDYDGILIFGVTLKKREKKLLPTRSQIAEITRAFNREYYYTPVIVVFRYENYISLANAERLKYKQEWREGEKAGKVSILRDIDIENPHTGHLKILEELKISRSGKKGINNFASLYKYWQEVFSVSLLSKKFYQELQNWYFWAIKHVTFPSESIYKDDKNDEYKAQNVIRLLTRLLFVWFIKEKKLIPEELFDIDKLQQDILKEISPYHDEDSMFKDANKNSIYYKAILQNLFFATLNCPIKLDSVDSRERGFRGDESYGKHRGVDYFMRYKKYFKKPDMFLEMVNKSVPFLNGGLFECLDDKENNVYMDGFSDNMTKGNSLIVPDYLFFGKDEKVDLTSDLGVTNRGAKEASVKGLIKILNSYKFTIAENTPIEEDVALDPELLGKVFENLLASYNPETKTTARKQTGSFYTPREIVNYMVDESLIAYLKTTILKEEPGYIELGDSQTNMFGNSQKSGQMSMQQKLDPSPYHHKENELDKKLHELFEFGSSNPFKDETPVTIKLLKAIDSAKILDPACGSGAFPMGILQKMVHILQKLDPDNKHWQDLQQEKAIRETKGVFVIKDKEEREQLLLEINDAFDVTVNNPDYARKLFLIENCIYGVDIQPIAAQISKLRFFISLVVEQKVNKKKVNFGIRPLPNLETKFVTANTLIGIEKVGDLFYTEEIKKKEDELKSIRHKLFGARTKATKIKYRKRDEELRNEIADILKKGNLPVESAEQLASWDPYDQNGISPFFDSEWMFDIKGFDVVIGNPPYVQIQSFSGQQCQKDWEAQNYKTFAKTGDIYSLFYEKGNMVLKDGGHLCFITSNKWMRANYGKATRQYFLENCTIKQLIDFGDSQIFESATTYTNILLFAKGENKYTTLACAMQKDFTNKTPIDTYLKDNGVVLDSLTSDSWIVMNTDEAKIKKRIEEIGTPLKEWDISINYGIRTGFNEAFIIDGVTKDRLIAEDPKSEEIIKPILRGRDIKRYKAKFADKWVILVKKEFHKEFKENYHILYKFVSQYETILKNRGQVRAGSHHWIEMDNSPTDKYFREFEKEKLIWLEMSPISNFTYSTENIFVLNTAYIMTGDSLKYLLSVINSSLLSWYFPLISTDVRGNTRRYIKQYVQNFPIPKISKDKMLPFETMADCILIAKENNLTFEADTLESVIDGMVYDLYFEDDMKEAGCYITDKITDAIKPFKEDDTDEFKMNYVKKMSEFCRNDKTIFNGLIHRRNIKVVEIINGDRK